jgi:hypothetical protein
MSEPAFRPVSEKPRLFKRKDGLWECIVLSKPKWWFGSRTPVSQSAPTASGAYWNLMFFLGHDRGN